MSRWKPTPLQAMGGLVALTLIVGGGNLWSGYTQARSQAHAVLVAEQTEQAAQRPMIFDQALSAPLLPGCAGDGGAAAGMCRGRPSLPSRTGAGGMAPSSSARSRTRAAA